MVAAGHGGSIINVTSIEGVRAAPGYAAYAAAKAGVINFTKTAALELAPHGIRVNGLAPDITLTEGLAALGRRRRRRALRGHVPMGRAGHVDEMAGAAVFLASDLSSYVTGQTIHVDGGTAAAGGWYHHPDDGHYVLGTHPTGRRCATEDFRSAVGRRVDADGVEHRSGCQGRRTRSATISLGTDLGLGQPAGARAPPDDRSRRGWPRSRAVGRDDAGRRLLHVAAGLGGLHLRLARAGEVVRRRASRSAAGHRTQVDKTGLPLVHLHGRPRRRRARRRCAG